MTKIRLVIFILSILIVGLVGTAAFWYANGYRLSKTNLQVVPNGLFVANSDPNGAQIFVNGNLKSATNSTISLDPGIYDVVLKKDGFLSWQKRITVQKQVVTQVDASLFSIAPSLSAVTFSGAINPQISPDGTKIAYVVNGTDEKSGLWVLENVSLPLGFSRDPKRITDGLLDNTTWTWSPDSRQILLTTKTSAFLLDANTFTTQSQLTNIASTKDTVLKNWQTLENQKVQSDLERLPQGLADILSIKASKVTLSPDETKVLYVASGSAEIRAGLIPALPGASTQKEVRTIEPGKTYVYDIKEDRNFEVADKGQTTYWLPSSLNIVMPEKDKVVVEDYDGTNQQAVYSGSYVAPFAFPSSGTGKLIILTNLGATGATPNLYSLSIK